MKPNRAALLVARLRFKYGLAFKVALGFLAFVAIVQAMFAAGWKQDKTYGLGPGWTCDRDSAVASDPVCWKSTHQKTAK